MKHYDFDLYQRYSALRDILHGIFLGATDSPISVLDVGSGATTFSQEFLGPSFSVEMTDVEESPGVTRLQPGQPLPFEDGSRRAVISMDVLEHVFPDQRALFVRECARVASDVVVIACPVDRPEVRESEMKFLTLHRELLGPHRFMQEHQERGLPDPNLVQQEWQRLGLRCFEIGNALLPHWEAFMLLDLIMYRDPEVVRLSTVAHELENARLAWSYKEGAHYRSIFIGTTRTEVASFLERTLPSWRRELAPEINSATLATAQVVADVLLKFDQTNKTLAGAHEQLNALKAELGHLKSEHDELKKRYEDAQRQTDESLSGQLRRAKEKIRGIVPRS